MSPIPSRTVDLGLISVMEALYEMDAMFDLQQTTRFAEAALQDDRREAFYLKIR